MRLDHLLQAHAFASSEERLPLKKAQQRIREHGLSVDGVLRKDPKYQVLPGVEAVTDGSGTAVQADHAFCLLNKPAGYVSQRHPTERNVYDLIPPELQRLGLVRETARRAWGCSKWRTPHLRSGWLAVCSVARSPPGALRL